MQQMTQNQAAEHAKVTAAAIALIVSSKRARRIAAANLWKIRGELISGKCTHKAANKLARWACDGYPKPQKPEALGYYRRALAELEFSRTRWTNPHDSEYYSACGYDDMQWEARHEARKAAPVFARAALLLAMARRARS